jgi:hypothetical protein
MPCTHGEGHVEDIGHHRAEALLVGLDLAGQAHPHEGTAVEPAAKGDHGVAPRRDAGDLDRVLAGLGAGGDEDRLLGPVARHLVVQPFGQTDVILVRQDLMAGMGKATHLLGHGGHHAGVAMPGVDHRDAGRKVDVAVALDIPDLGIQGAIGIDLRHHADPARDRLVAPLGHFRIEHRLLPRHETGAVSPVIAPSATGSQHKAGQGCRNARKIGRARENLAPLAALSRPMLRNVARREEFSQKILRLTPRRQRIFRENSLHPSPKNFRRKFFGARRGRAAGGLRFSPVPHPCPRAGQGGRPSCAPAPCAGHAWPAGGYP